MGKRKIIINSL